MTVLRYGTVDMSGKIVHGWWIRRCFEHMACSRRVASELAREFMFFKVLFGAGRVRE